MSPGLPGTLIGTLLDWYDENGRHSFPWREPDRSAFEILIAEILLQKTTATAVSGAYVPLIARYPTPESIVAAPSDEIVPSERGSDFLHAMLDFSAAVCTARSPGCGDCQLEGECGSSRKFEARDSE